MLRWTYDVICIMTNMLQSIICCNNRRVMQLCLIIGLMQFTAGSYFAKMLIFFPQSAAAFSQVF